MFCRTTGFNVVRWDRPRNTSAGDFLNPGFVVFCNSRMFFNKAIGVGDTFLSFLRIFTALSAAPLDCGYSAVLGQKHVPHSERNC